MDRRIRMAMAAIVLAAFATGANAQVQGGFFIGGNLGASYYHDHGLDDRSDIASSLRAGYEWRTDEFLDDRFGFGVELGYADLGKAHGKVAGELYKNGQFVGYAVANASLQTNVKYDELHKPEVESVNKHSDRKIASTYPLQLIRAPTAPDSRRLKPKSLAAVKHEINFEKNETAQMRTTYPHVIPLSRRPKLVLNPESVKY